MQKTKKAYYCISTKFIVIVYLVIIVVIFCISSRVYMMETKEIKCVDVYTATGFYVTVLGFVLAISELGRARTLAQESLKATQDTALKGRDQYYQNRLTHAKIILAELCYCVKTYNWALASMHSQYLFACLIDIDSSYGKNDARWQEYKSRLSVYQGKFYINIGNNGHAIAIVSDNKWFILRQEIFEALTVQLTPPYPMVDIHGAR